MVTWVKNCLPLLVCVHIVHALILDGRVISINDVPTSAWGAQKPLCIQVFEAPTIDGHTETFQVDDIYAGRGLVASAVSTADDGKFSVSLPSTARAVGVLAFTSSSARCDLDLSRFEAVGWYKDVNTTFWMEAIPAEVVPHKTFEVAINSVAAFPRDNKSCCGGAGLLTHVKGNAVLRLKGSRAERGYAHGCLMYPYIVSHFRFFTLEGNTNGVHHYEHTVLPFVRRAYRPSQAYEEEMRGVLEGMTNCSTSDGAKDALYVPELQRGMTLDDLYYLNTYGTYNEGNTQLPERCSQLAVWGNLTADSNTIVGRNMDGENDFRKVTVANVVIFSIVPTRKEEGEHRFVHVFWPGFIGTASGLSETGVHVMDNDGPSSPLPGFATNGTSDSWVQRAVLATATTVSDANDIIRSFASSLGGTCIAGCNMVLAGPSHHAAAHDGSTPVRVVAQVYEGDRAGGEFRVADEAVPYGADHIMATNHFLKYGFDPLHPLDNFGKQVSFGSLWRYAAGSSLVKYLREYKRHQVTYADVQQFLRHVTQGATEHSLITLPAEGVISFAKADMKTGGWFAPHLEWVNYTLNELFAL